MDGWPECEKPPNYNKLLTLDQLEFCRYHDTPTVIIDKG